MLGWARAVEVTHGAHGWHVHIHVLLCWDHPVDEAAAQRVVFRMWGRWDRALRRRGLDSSPTRGLDARPVRFDRADGGGGLGDYFVKISREVTSSYAKDSKGGRSPLAIDRDAVETYKAEDVELWWQFEDASRGRKQLTWSTGRRDLRRFAGLRREQTDEEIAAEETGGDELISLPADTWETISRAGQEAQVLDIAETEGMAGATAWLDARRLAWAPATPPPRRDRTCPPLARRSALGAARGGPVALLRVGRPVTAVEDHEVSSVDDTGVASPGLDEWVAVVVAHVRSSGT